MNASRQKTAPARTRRVARVTCRPGPARGVPELPGICRHEFKQIHRKLDHLDDAIRGNGSPGINRRLDRLELAAAARKRLTWIVLGAFASAGASAAMQLFQLLGKH